MFIPLICPFQKHSYCTTSRPSQLKEVQSLDQNICVYTSLCNCSANKSLPYGSMRKANSLSECRLLRVRRSGRRSRSLEKRAESSERRRQISDRRAWIRPSCSCSTALMSEMPERSGRKEDSQCQLFTMLVYSLTISETISHCAAAYTAHCESINTSSTCSHFCHFPTTNNIQCISLECGIIDQHGEPIAIVKCNRLKKNLNSFAFFFQI